MREDARVRINAHRLVRTPSEPGFVARIDHTSSIMEGRVQESRERMLRRVWVHIGVFVLSFVFTSGVMLLLVLLWVRPDNLFALVASGLVASLTFVASFASLRMLVLHKLLNEYPERDEDPGVHHHVGKSIAYGILALVLAFLLVAGIVNVVGAFGS